jgi:hypothetical protein
MTAKRQKQRKKQIPFGNDSQKGKAKEEADSLTGMTDNHAADGAEG